MAGGSACVRCGAPLPPGARYCSACGTPVETAGPVGPPPPGVTTPGSAPPPVPPTPPSPSRRPSAQTLLLAAGGVLALLVVGTLVFVALRDGDERTREDESPLPSPSPSATEAPQGVADPAGLTTFEPKQSGRATCGDYRIRWQSAGFEPGQAKARLIVTGPGGRALRIAERVEGPVYQLSPLWCGDALGDGSTVLAVEHFTGGAHCCFKVDVVELGSGRTLLQQDLGNFGGLEPVQLNGEGAVELEALSDALAYFDGIAFAESPALPRIFAFDGGEYREATANFGGILELERGEALKVLRRSMRREDTFTGVAAQLVRAYGLSVLMGTPQDGFRELRGEVPAELAAWLYRYLGEAHSALSAQFGLPSGASSPPNVTDPVTTLPAAQGVVVHGGLTWGVYVYVGDYDTFEMDEAIERMKALGLQEGSEFSWGDIACDEGALGGLPVEGSAMVGVYFRREVKARRFAEALYPPAVGVAHVRTYCAD